MQEPVSPESPPRKREEAFVGLETNLPERSRRENHGLPGRRSQIARHNLNAVIAEQLDEAVDHRAVALQEQAQRLEIELGEADVGQAIEFQADHRRSAAGGHGRLDPVGRTPIGGFHFQRPQGGVEARLEFARRAGHRRRVEDGEKRLDDFRKLVVDFGVNARRQECEAFQQALHVRIFALAGLQQKTAGHLGIFVREFGAQIPQVGQLLRIVEQQFVAHARFPSRCTNPW